jgi:predicted DNA-binding transcriptional regulator AlpA
MHTEVLPSLGKTYSAAETCAIVGRSLRTLDEWVKRNLFPRPLRVGNGRRFWKAADIQAFLDRIERERQAV